MPEHHLSEEVLMAYAAGSLPEALSLVVASHATLCPSCRADVEAYEALGGSLIEDIDPAALPEATLSDIFARLDADEAGGASEPWGSTHTPARRDFENSSIPRPLRDYLDQDLAALAWRPVIRGVEEAEIKLAGAGVRTRLMRIKAGVAMPRHTHAGEEVTLVLEGGYSDAEGHFARGDVQIADPSVDHQPVADEGEACICLVVSDAPLKLTGPIGRLLNPFISY
ncbi:anti-sigma factor [Pelagibius litoralis]|uniref:Anti-sigma factor n=1 Tax=Pelagibius litoralis TaxID=374515 RepID=A0A967C1W3_9PROT|nr:ChrR family anti-sigma-E factor [Pelagibius litoralis]NIA68146.1 anti-sigma factor [Pelagibius litoralis]